VQLRPWRPRCPWQALSAPSDGAAAVSGNQEDAMKSARPAVKTRSRELAARFTAAEPLGGGEHVYRVIEVVGTSSTSISDAIDRAIARAHKTLRNLRWFEVLRTSGHIENGKVRHYQVTLSVGFTMEEPG
jgi:flavin-binding protein dodecin